VRDVATPVWCILVDGPAAGHVRETPSTARHMLVILDDNEVAHYILFAGCPKHRIARFRWQPSQDLIGG
jgi:hypothetical protein